MKGKYIFLLAALMISPTVSAQQLDRQVIASAGSSDASSSFTIGEVIVSSDNLEVVAGFQQPSFLTEDEPLGITDITSKLNVFPIPTKSVVTINGEYFDGIETKTILYTIDGKRVEVVPERFQNELKLDLSDLPSGYYYLSLFNKKSNTIAKYKILKY